MLESILVGVDQSTTSIDALIWADQLAATTAATLRAMQTWEASQPSLLGSLLGTPPTDEALQNESREALQQTIATTQLGGDPEQILRQGHPGQALVSESQADDLVVLGRTGSGFRRFAQIILGSTTRYVINNAHVAVAVVPEGTQWADSPRVLVGIDGSASSCKALRWAVRNLPESAEISAVWALQYWSETLKEDDIELFRHASEDVLPELHRCIALATKNDESLMQRVTAEVRPGSPREVFANADAEVDLVIVGKNGSSGTAIPIVGSVTDHLVRYASCPVIVTPN